MLFLRSQPFREVAGWRALAFQVLAGNLVRIHQLEQSGPRLGRVQRSELLGAVLPGDDRDRRGAARVVVKVLGRVVHLAVDDEEWIRFTQYFFTHSHTI